MKGYIVYVSEQTFPVVQGIVWAHNNGFDRVVLLYTKNSGEKSEKPANRIKNMCKKLQERKIWRYFFVEELSIEDFTPQGVTNTIDPLMKNIQGEWVINTTGGLKLMSFGSANFIGRCEIHYKELNGGWFKLVAGDGQPIKAITWLEEEGAPERNITDNIPIELLAEAQFPSDKYDVSVNDGHFLRPLVPKLTELIEDIATDGKWDRAFENQLRLRVRPSKALEYFLYLMFCRLGMRNQDMPNVALNLIVTARREAGKPQGKQPLEADVVANFNGSLRFLEAKWECSGLPTLLKKLANLRELSGIGGSVGLYAPFVELGEGDDALVAVYRVEFWNEASRADLVPCLYDFIHGKGAWERVGSKDEELLALDTLFREKETQLFIRFEPMVETLDSEVGGHNWSYFRIGSMGVLLWRSKDSSEKLIEAFKNKTKFVLTSKGKTMRKTNGQQSREKAVPAKSEKMAQVFICDDADDELCKWLMEKHKSGLYELTSEALRGR